MRMGMRSSNVARANCPAPGEKVMTDSSGPMVDKIVFHRAADLHPPDDVTTAMLLLP